MNEVFQENKKILISLVVVLFIGAFALYYFLVMPVKDSLDSTEIAIDTLENDKLYITTMINNLRNEEPEIDGEELVLKNRIPDERKLDEYILSLLELQEITGSEIVSVNFAYDSGTEHIEIGAEVPEEGSEEEALTETPEDVEGIEETDVAPIVIDPVIIEEKPESLEVLVVRVQARSRNFDEYLELIEAIESQDRISIVSNLTFKNPAEEEVFFSDHKIDEEMVEFTVELTTFYYPNK